ncbi:AAA family ATPase [Brucepastera parasyntrophica]|uniref:AAA family ATPase n=1 Tax=Brucepastera parasyntrophica TaxID=2880008 RepID=UPI0034E24EBF
MRADIAASMLHNPKVLFLDEPTIGLDIVVKDNIRKAIQEINRTENTTIILTTHDLNDIELLCKRIVLIDKGQIVFDGDMSHIKEIFGQVREISFVLTDPSDIDKLHLKPSRDQEVLQEGNQFTVRFNTGIISVPKMLSNILAAVSVSDIVIKDIDIEEILRRVYRKQVEI